MAFDKDLPDELMSGGEAAPDELQTAKLDALSVAIAGKVQEAVKARKESGLEEVWMAAEEAYLCIDDTNRGDFQKAKWAKPVSMNGPVTRENVNADPNKSNAYVRMTARYVDAGSSRVGEIILPIGDKAFSFGPTPVPELVDAKDDTTPLAVNGMAVQRPNETGQMVQATTADLAQVNLDKAKKAADKAEKRIYDWLTECHYPAEARKVIFDSCRIGVGVLKGPYPDMKQGRAITKTAEGVKLAFSSKVKPAVKWIDPWNFFPDGACGEDVHSGDYCVERDFLTPGKVKALKKKKDSEGAPVYLNDQIDKVLKEGPGKVNVESQNPNKPNVEKQFEIWYFHGTLTKAEMQAGRAIGIEDVTEDDIHAIVTMINDTVIQVTVNPMESGKFPYRAKPWSRRQGHWAGVGAAEQVSMPQRMVNAATRALLNNAGLSSGLQIVVDRMKIVPADGKWTITPNKLWYTADGETVEDVSKAFRGIEFPNATDALMAIIQYAFKLAEEATNIPLISQGQTGETTPQTFGATELQNNNANTFLRSQGYSWDDFVTEPMIDDFYEYLLLDPKVPEDEKGDFEINARGSIAMVEKAIQEVFYINLLGVSKDPAYGVDPKKVMEEILTGKRIDVRKVKYTEEELKKMAEAPPPEDPTITAAKIRADATIKTAQSRDAATVRKSELDTDRDAAYENALNRRAEIQSESDQKELDLKRELEIYKENNKMAQKLKDRETELDKIKAKLATVTMELQTQIKLAGASNNAKQVAPTDMEPVGRAPDGQAFQA
jgi:hypothetical protein